MNTQTIREFRLSPPGGGRGISCNANGAFVGSVPLLKRARVNGKEVWEPRDCDELSKRIGSNYGLPIDISSKAGGLHAISHALNEGDIARAQVATVLLAIPEPPNLSKGAHSRGDLIKFVRDLYWSGMIKADWKPDEHPRWPAGAPDSQGGQFAPKGTDPTTLPRSYALSGEEGKAKEINDLLIPVAANVNEARSRGPSRKREAECQALMDSDMYVCGSLRDRREREICRASANERYSACLRGKPLPPLALPNPEYEFQPHPASPIAP
ncbi:MAG: hypothetical protein ACLQUZ_00700 [Rhizomicrobium sp.]